MNTLPSEHALPHLDRAKASGGGLTLEDHRGLLAAIDRMVGCDTPETLCRVAVDETARLLPSVSCAWTEVNLQTGYTRGCMNVPIDPATVVREMEPVVSEHPVIQAFLKTRDGSARAISDFLSRRKFQAMALYRNFYRKYRTEDQLSISALFEEQWLAGLVVNRGTWGFSPREHDVLNALRPTLFQVYGQLRRLAELSTASSGISLQEETRQVLVHQLMARGLSRREAEVVTTITEGKTNGEIAGVLGISEGTVRKHVNRVFLKLGVHNRAEATRASLSLLNRRMP